MTTVWIFVPPRSIPPLKLTASAYSFSHSLSRAGGGLDLPRSL
jgi:hypothetical protein